MARQPALESAEPGLRAASMRYGDFIAKVADRAGVPPEDAERATGAVLSTLAERIGEKEAAETAAQLPKELQAALAAPPVARRFDAREFVSRVAHRAGVDDAHARELTRAVFTTLHEAVSHGELEDWEADLSSDYIDLAARHADVGQNPRAAPPDSAARGAVVGAREFLRRVADRAGLDEQRAREATEAVLETFGERIADGEARDLAQQLPDPAAEPLLRPGGDPRAIPAEEFVHRVAERERTLDFVAREHARAVLTTVRESVTVDEWDDTIAELPREYDELLA
jgi:uncharacterized protein (DUF2267 family)